MLQAHLGYILESTLLEEMAQVAKIRETAADEIVVNVGDHLQMIPIVIDGSIKISRENSTNTKLGANLFWIVIKGYSSNLKQEVKSSCLAIK
jgi:hypothetical protein